MLWNILGYNTSKIILFLVYTTIYLYVFDVVVKACIVDLLKIINQRNFALCFITMYFYNLWNQLFKILSN